MHKSKTHSVYGYKWTILEFILIFESIVSEISEFKLTYSFIIIMDFIKMKVNGFLSRI